MLSLRSINKATAREAAAGGSLVIQTGRATSVSKQPRPNRRREVSARILERGIPRRIWLRIASAIAAASGMPHNQPMGYSNKMAAIISLRVSENTSGCGRGKPGANDWDQYS